jgi:hypothetical protein
MRQKHFHKRQQLTVLFSDEWVRDPHENFNKYVDPWLLLRLGPWHDPLFLENGKQNAQGQKPEYLKKDLD